VKSLHLVSLILLLTGTVFSKSADANVFYFEFGGGLAQGSSIQSVYPTSLQKNWDSAYSIPLTLGYQLQESQSGILFSLAGQARYVGGTNASGSYTLLTTTPMLRMELWKLVLGAGYTPWVWQSIEFKKLQAKALTFEAQILFPITPEIDFGLQAARQQITPNESGSTLVTMEYGAFFRLNFGMSDTQATQRRKYKGWRYPYGNPKR